MKKTNILVEVDDRVHDLVVAPHKKQKTFSKLIASLLQGYIEDDYIRAYAEGTLEDMHKASVDALDDVLGGMQQSLFSMGLYTGELKSNTEKGVEAVKSAVENSENTTTDAKTNSSEVESLRGDMLELQQQNQQIMSILKELTSNTPKVIERVVEKEEERIPEEVAVEKTQSKPSYPEGMNSLKESDQVDVYDEEDEISLFDSIENNSVKEVDTPNSTDSILVEGDISTTLQILDDDEDDEEINATDALSSLLQGNTYSF